jgi:deferrochelatase/peroxidase EfeB
MNDSRASSPPKPLPTLDGRFQPGITDPQWPIIAPEGVEAERYRIERAGRVNPQGFLTIVAADLRVATRTELGEVVRKVSDFARREMARDPVIHNAPVLEFVPPNYRVTVTVGLGTPLFQTAHGDDRFGLCHARPKGLKTMPRVMGDEYDPAADAADLVIVIASDHPYVNVAIARSLIHGYVDKRIVIRRIEQGFSRPDKREFLRFDDGIDNLSNANDGELDRFAYVHPGDGEPDWCVNGAYLAWRKIRENLPIWEAMKQHEQEGSIGREKRSGQPLSRKRTGPGGMTPVYPNPHDAKDGPLNAHIRKVQPRRPGMDLLGVGDLERRFLRRGYPFFDGLDGDKQLQCGLLFLAFARDLRKQFEWPVQMWQTNPDFPEPGTGVDALYGRKVLSNIAGGYYFCPPAPRRKDDFLASALFS